MHTYLAVFDSEDEQFACVSDQTQADGEFMPDGMSRYLDDPRTARIEVRDDDDRVRGIARPAGTR